MNKRQSSLGIAMVAILAAILLVVLNPKQPDFKAYLADHRATEASSSGGVFGEIGKGLGKTMGGLESGLYRRTDYLLFSTYSLGGENGAVYLGIAKLFVRLK